MKCLSRYSYVMKLQINKVTITISDRLMKKLIITAVLASLFCFGASAKSLKVYSVTGNVTQKSGAAWNKVAKANVLTDAATVKINPSSSLRVLDPSTRQIYTFSSPGEFNLGALLKQSAKENGSLTGKIGAESRRQMAANSSKSHKAVGAATRATLDEEVLEALYTALVTGFAAGQDTGVLTMTERPLEDGLFTVSLTNTSDEPVYANLFAKSDDGHWASVLEFDNDETALLIAPGATVSLDHIVLVRMPGDKLVAVGFDQQFEGEELNDMFAEEFEPGETKASNVSLFFLK